MRYGSTKSCGCLKQEIIKKQQIDSQTHKMTGTRIYRIWSGMIERCENKKGKDFENYGGRGIKICERWRHSLINFINDTKDGYSDSLSINRIDNNGNYEPGNCEWSTAKEQGNNTRINKLITYNNETKTQSQWSTIFNIQRCVLAHRLKAGWPVSEALNTPVKKYNLKK
jgi:hypothetical protein